MYEIKLPWPNRVTVIEDPDHFHLDKPSLWKRHILNLIPLIVIALVFMFWSSVSPSMTVIVGRFEARPVSRENAGGESIAASGENVEGTAEASITECLQRFDGRGLWTRDSESFQEPSCQAVLEDDGDNADASKDWVPSDQFDDKNLLDLVSNCTLFRRAAVFAERPHSMEEAAYPIAYVITAQENAAQTLRFLRNVYWPQNSYCFALAPDSSSDYRNVLHSVTACFNGTVMVAGGRNPETLMAPQKRFRFLENIVECLRQLTRDGQSNWTYTQIVSSEDFPLKTNLQLVTILSMLNGSNDCGLSYGIQSDYCEDHNTIGNRSMKTAPPGGLIPYSGTLESVLSRTFVDFLLENAISQSFLRWLSGTEFPELYYWSTIMHNTLLDPPSGFPGVCLAFMSLRGEKKRTMSRIKIWDEEYFDERRDCRNNRSFVEGDWKSTCRAHLRDVAWYIQRPHLMAHRFDATHEPASLYCLEKWHWKKVCENVTHVDTEILEQLQGVKYASMRDKEEYLC